MCDSPLNGKRTRLSGAMEPLYWSPASDIFEMPLQGASLAHLCTRATPCRDSARVSPAWPEAKLLPQRVVWFGSTTGCPREVLKFIKPECRNQPFLLQSNFEISAELKELLSKVVAATREGKPAHAWRAESITRLLTLQDECLEAFAACAAESRRRAKDA